MYEMYLRIIVATVSGMVKFASKLGFLFFFIDWTPSHWTVIITFLRTVEPPWWTQVRPIDGLKRYLDREFTNRFMCNHCIECPHNVQGLSICHLWQFNPLACLPKPLLHAHTKNGSTWKTRPIFMTTMYLCMTCRPICCEYPLVRLELQTE